MAGVWGDYECYRYQQAFELSWSQYIDTNVPTTIVISDAELVLHAGLPNPSGMVLIAGTGSIAVGKTAEGVVKRCGGWGPRVDDAGGGFWLGREALRAVARTLDGRGPETALIRPVSAYLRVDQADRHSMQARLRATPVDNAARLGRTVLTYADEGDAVARNIRHRGATELAELVRALHREMPEVGDHVVCYGSLLLDAGYRALVERYSIDVNQDLVFEPLADVMGALAAVG
jgi:N-acetylglucosamine kinase-like BadF-type ATPase